MTDTSRDKRARRFTPRDSKKLWRLIEVYVEASIFAAIHGVDELPSHPINRREARTRQALRDFIEACEGR